jgi:hypothetical protein
MKTLSLILLSALFSLTANASLSIIKKLTVKMDRSISCFTEGSSSTSNVSLRIKTNNESFTAATKFYFENSEVCHQYNLLINSFGIDLDNHRNNIEHTIYVKDLRNIIGFQHPSDDSIVFVDLMQKQQD